VRFILLLFLLVSCERQIHTVECEKACLKEMSGKLGAATIEWCKDYASQGNCCTNDCCSYEAYLCHD